MPTTPPNESKNEVQRGVETIGKIYRGLVSLGKEVLPKSTEEFLKKAEQPIKELRNTAATVAQAIHDISEKNRPSVREAARKQWPLTGVDAQALERLLTQTEADLTTARTEKDRLRCLILQVIALAAKDPKAAIQSLKKGFFSAE